MSVAMKRTTTSAWKAASTWTRRIGLASPTLISVLMRICRGEQNICWRLRKSDKWKMELSVYFRLAYQYWNAGDNQISNQEKELMKELWREKYPYIRINGLWYSKIHSSHIFLISAFIFYQLFLFTLKTWIPIKVYREEIFYSLPLIKGYWIVRAIK